MTLLPTDMYLGQIIQVKITLLGFLKKSTPLRKMSFMNIPTISTKYINSALPRKDHILELGIHMLEEQDQANKIHGFNQFEKECRVE